MPRDLSISVHFARALLQNTVPCGLDPSELLRRNRISPRLLHEDSARISVERYADLQVSTMLAMADESLGYASRRVPIGSWSMMCHAVIGCDSLGQALSRYCRFYQLFDLDVYPVFTTDENTATLRLENRNPALPLAPYLAEMQLFNAHRFGSWLVREHLPVQAVRLDYPMAASAADYRHMFLGNPVCFEQADCALVFSHSLLEKRTRQTAQTLRHFLRHPALIMLTQRYAQTSWTARVRDLVASDLMQMPEFPAVAAQLDLHPQTLRRRLSAEGTTFKEIKLQLRRDTALHYLGKQGLSIEEIAHRAGFSEASAFIRAFKGWTGLTPYSYRKGI